MLGKGSRQMKELLSLFLLQCLNTKKRKQEKNPQEILQLSLLQDMHFCFRDHLKWFFSLIKKILAFLILLYFHANIVNTVFSDCTQLLNWREIYSTWKNNLLQSMKMSEHVKISYTNPAEILLFINLLYFVQMKFNHNIPLLFSFPSFLLFLVRFANANRSSFSSSSSLCRLPCWETPVLTFSVAHICLSITAWPPCFSFSNSEFLRQPAVLYRPQKYLSHCTTEIWKTICQGEVWLKCLSKTACRLEDNQSDAGIPNHTLRIKSKKKIKNHSQRQRKAWKKQIHFKCALCSERVYPT